MSASIDQVIQQLSAMYTESSNLSTRLHSVITNKTTLWTFTTIKISNSIAHTVRCHNTSQVVLQGKDHLFNIV
jgi:hypothetical protein